MENSEKKIKHIEVGKIYLIHDGTRTGHPGFIVHKDCKNNRYLVVRFDSDKAGDIPKIDRGVRHITRLTHVIGGGVMTSYAKNRPMLCKRKDIGKEMPDLSIHSDDMETILQIVNKIVKQNI